MEEQSNDSLVAKGTFEAEAPGLAGIVGRMRLMVGDQALGVLVVDNGRVKLAPDETSGGRERAFASRVTFSSRSCAGSSIQSSWRSRRKAGCTAIARSA